jgi:Conserved in the green lineage and diatoms 27
MYFSKVCAVIFLVACGLERSYAFLGQSRGLAPRSIGLSSSKDDEGFSLSPQTSFGAEAVPESQRPVNEFLDVTNQPMFGWASLETGSKGLLTRLAIVYSVLFAVV